ncbi:MAG: GIY-YIG nuclease family protein [Anaerolineales bacterium]|nr:GIY-YIG nuclease family protein [Anaerolineales bacterium]
MIMAVFPADSGSYALFLTLSSPQTLQIGRLGAGFFPPGIYIYFGSARGPGGLRARLGRHLRGGGKSHWHIDALRAVTEVKGFCYITDQKDTSFTTPIECLWSQALAALPDTSVPLPGFGASDCRAGCPAHLIALPVDKKKVLSVYGDILAEVLQVPRKAISRRTGSSSALSNL